jgi:hypothetical protein
MYCTLTGHPKMCKYGHSMLMMVYLTLPAADANSRWACTCASVAGIGSGSGNGTSTSTPPGAIALAKLLQSGPPGTPIPGTRAREVTGSAAAASCWLGPQRRRREAEPQKGLELTRLPEYDVQARVTDGGGGPFVLWRPVLRRLGAGRRWRCVWGQPVQRRRCVRRWGVSAVPVHHPRVSC